MRVSLVVESEDVKLEKAPHGNRRSGSNVDEEGLERLGSEGAGEVSCKAKKSQYLTLRIFLSFTEGLTQKFGATHQGQ